jgi:hypothetical protein
MKSWKTRTLSMLQQNFFNPAAPTGLDMCCIINVLIIRHYLCWPYFFHVIFYYYLYSWVAQLTRWVFHLGISFSLQFRGIRTPFYFTWSMESIIVGPFKSFPLEWTGVYHLHKALSSCTNWDCLHVCCFRGSFTISFDAIKDSNQSFCFLYHKQLTILCCMKP